MLSARIRCFALYHSLAFVMGAYRKLGTAVGQRWGRLAVQHRRLPIPVASRDMLCPPPPRAKEAELPTAKGEEAAASTNIYVCLHISAAKRPPVAYEVPLCAVPYVQYAWGPVGTAKCPSQ